MNDRTRPGAGFTVVEILAALTIVSIVISLILPAVLTAREAARRTGCINNLRQLALAVQNYEQQANVLPSGVVDHSGPIRNQPEGLHIGWIVQLLPEMEQRAIYNGINTELSVDDGANLSAAVTQIHSLLCPSDPLRGRIRFRGVSHYAGGHHDVEAPIDRDNHGVFFLNSRVSTPTIFDGASFTIFFGEKAVAPDDLGWMSGTRATLRNTGSPLNATIPLAPDAVGGFRSFHPAGANFAFGDGGVRFLSERIDPRVYRLLGHRDDGEMIDDDAFDP